MNFDSSDSIASAVAGRRINGGHFRNGARWGFPSTLHWKASSMISFPAKDPAQLDRSSYSELDFSSLLHINSHKADDAIKNARGYLDATIDLSYLPKLPPLEEHKPVVVDHGKKVVLSNGMEVWLLPEAGSGLVHITGRVFSGSVFDEQGKSGTAALVATLLLQKTEHYTYADFVTSLEEDISDLSFQPGRESVSIGGFSLPENFDRLIQIVQEALIMPDFQSEDVSELAEALAANSGPETQSANDIARESVQAAVFPDDHPYHHFPTAESYMSITHEDVVSFYKKHYGPATTKLIITGEFDVKEMEEVMEQLFGSWKSDAKVSLEKMKDPIPSKTLMKERVQVEGIADLITVIGREGVSRCAENYGVAQVANQILGGDTLSARLGTHVRDQKGLTYGVSSSYESGILSGMYLIHMQTAPDKTDEAVKEIYNVLDDWSKHGASDVEVDVAKRHLLSQMTMSLSDPSSIGSFLVTQHMCGVSDPVEAIKQSHKQLLSVTTDQVNKHIKKMMSPDAMHEVVAGAVEDIPSAKALL